MGYNTYYWPGDNERHGSEEELALTWEVTLLRIHINFFFFLHIVNGYLAELEGLCLLPREFLRIWNF